MEPNLTLEERLYDKVIIVGPSSHFASLVVGKSKCLVEILYYPPAHVLWVQ